MGQKAISVAATEDQIHVTKCQVGTLPENETETVKNQVIKMITWFAAERIKFPDWELEVGISKFGKVSGWHFATEMFG